MRQQDAPTGAQISPGGYYPAGGGAFVPVNWDNTLAPVSSPITPIVPSATTPAVAPQKIPGVSPYPQSPLVSTNGHYYHLAGTQYYDEQGNLSQFTTNNPPPGITSTTPVPASTPAPTPAPVPIPTTTPTYTGVSVVDYLKSIGQPSDYASRATLAAQKGIANYAGTPDQNTQLLNILRGGTIPTTPTAPITPATSTTPVGTIGTWIGQDGQGYSGPKKNANDQPASSTTGQPITPTIPAPAPAPIPTPAPPEDTQTQLGNSLASIGTATTDEERNAAIAETVRLAASLGIPYADIEGYISAMTPAQTKTEEELRTELYTKYGITGLEDKFKTQPTQTFEEIYQTIYDSLGLTQMKVDMDNLRAKIAQADADYATATGTINENPWISEAGRVGKIEKLNINYNNTKNQLNNQMTLLDNQYTRGKQDAENVATRTLNAFDKTHEYAKEELQYYISRAESDLTAKLKSQTTTAEQAKYKYYPEYVSAYQEPTKTTSTSQTEEEKIISAFNKDLDNYDKQIQEGMTRETIIGRLQIKYSNIDPNDIAKKVYEYYPDSYVNQYNQ